MIASHLYPPATVLSVSGDAEVETWRVGVVSPLEHGRLGRLVLLSRGL